MNTFISIFIVVYLALVGWLTYEMINAPLVDENENEIDDQNQENK